MIELWLKMVHSSLNGNSLYSGFHGLRKSNANSSVQQTSYLWIWLEIMVWLFYLLNSLMRSQDKIPASINYIRKQIDPEGNAFSHLKRVTLHGLVKLEDSREKTWKY